VWFGRRERGGASECENCAILGLIAQSDGEIAQLSEGDAQFSGAIAVPVASGLFSFAFMAVPFVGDRNRQNGRRGKAPHGAFSVVAGSSGPVVSGSELRAVPQSLVRV
jgi:hypothetical protein